MWADRGNLMVRFPQLYNTLMLHYVKWLLFYAQASSHPKPILALLKTDSPGSSHSSLIARTFSFDNLLLIFPQSMIAFLKIGCFRMTFRKLLRSNVSWSSILEWVTSKKIEFYCHHDFCFSANNLFLPKHLRIFCLFGAEKWVYILLSTDTFSYSPFHSFYSHRIFKISL